jgi:gamma-glutamyltranspeptidase/glutathione hydrolase
MSSMSPTLVAAPGASQPFLAIGTPGGSRIIGALFNVLLRRLGLETTTLAAIEAPRTISRNDKAQMEPALFTRAEEAVALLQRRGFAVENGETALTENFVQSVELKRRPDGGTQLIGVADMTRLPTALALGF